MMQLLIIQRLYRLIQRMPILITTKVYHWTGEVITNRLLSALVQPFRLNRGKQISTITEALHFESCATLSLRFQTTLRQSIWTRSISRHTTIEHFVGIKLVNFKKLKMIIYAQLVFSLEIFKQCIT